MLKDAPVIPYIPASDLARARKFYEETLELEPVEVYGPVGVFYKSGKDTIFFLFRSSGAGSSKSTLVFWKVADIGKEVAHLKTRGVKFDHYDLPGMEWKDDIATGGGARTAWFKDSEGNILALSQRQ